jgi:hypothetical protein
VTRKTLKAIGLTMACLMAGFAFYKFDGDPLVAGFFTFGILGIVLSALREKPAVTKKSSATPEAKS